MSQAPNGEEWCQGIEAGMGQNCFLLLKQGKNLPVIRPSGGNMK
jgi:hypothetical protein